MFSKINSRFSKKRRATIVRRALACLLAGALCTMNAPWLLAQDGAATTPPVTPLFNTAADLNLVPEQPTSNSRWASTPLFAESAPALRPVTSSPLNLPSSDVLPIAKYSPPIATHSPRATLLDQPDNTASSGSDHHRLYKDLGILGIGLLAGGITTFSLARSSHCATPTSPGACSNLDHTGEVLMPVGGALAALGFIMAYHHHH
jgi:hypothetical protein